MHKYFSKYSLGQKLNYDEEVIAQRFKEMSETEIEPGMTPGNTSFEKWQNYVIGCTTEYVNYIIVAKERHLK